jgi:acetate kinase
MLHRESKMTSQSQVGGCVLVVNGGSSSLKFAAYRAGQRPVCILSGKFDRIGRQDATLTLTDTNGRQERHAVAVADHSACVPMVAELLNAIEPRINVRAIGHRVVHGANMFYAPQRITGELVGQLRRLSSFAPAHMPVQIALIEAFGACYKELPQVACFDTAFHRDIPRVARLLPIPRKYDAAGVQRYGFHGLSYTYLMGELESIAGTDAARGRIILAHLGNGASMAAVRDGRSVDTTMAFTPAAGLVMSTRSGDLDPGVIEYLAETEGMTARQFYEMVHAKSGLLGVSEISSDVRDLLKCEAKDVRAAEAIALFCYSAKKWIGALTAALGGLDTLVFSGGIGENSPVVRARICDGLDYLGIGIDQARNEASAAIIASDDSRVAVRVIPTNEESLIAQTVLSMVG